MVRSQLDVPAHVDSGDPRATGTPLCLEGCELGSAASGGHGQRAALHSS
jgi:hypothetical protein